MECPNKRVEFAGGSGVVCAYNLPADGEAGFCSRPEYYRCIEDVNRMVIPLSYSSVSNFLTCHNLFYLKNIRGIEIRKESTSPAMKMGTLWDKCLQKYLGNDEIDLNEVVQEHEIDVMDVAKVRAMYRAYRDIGMEVDKEYDLQATFKKDVQVYDEEMNERSRIMITGIYDRKYEAAFAENKFSGRPEMYFDLFFLQSQIGAYFLADENLLYVDMEVARAPQLKQTAKNKDELPQEFEERIYSDIISRPSFYFPHYDNRKNRYGRRFYRNEFNIDEIRDRFKHVSREIHEACAYDGWYKNDRVCNSILPGIVCDMLPVCRHNTMAENVFKIRDIPADKL